MVSLLSIVKTGRFQLKRALLDTGNTSICQICQYKNTFIRLPCLRPYGLERGTASASERNWSV
uniref:Uncharacterized protein n=2 Tax=Candidatus Kentrum eta TaxID=2126337 RepID=A0A450VEU3_9GAMM|nr:MAG: hypothetical protein BECKH772C_GA0070978_101251 [Candidatus Kentron sp. H]